MPPGSMHARSCPSFWLTCAFAIALGVPADAAETARENFWITDGEVRAIESVGDALYLGGEFTAVGPALGSAGVFDFASGDVRTPHAGVNGPVYAVSPDFAGGFYIGGDFTRVRGELRRNLAQIDANGEVTSWDPGVEGIVYCIARSGTKVFFGGEFTSVGGEARTSLAWVDADTGQLSTWAPYPESVGTITCLAVSASHLYVGGRFSRIDFATRNDVAAFDLSTGALTSFYAGTSGGGVKALFVHGSSLFMAGGFSQVREQLRRGIAEVDAATGQLSSWNPHLPSSSRVHAVAVTQRNSFPFDRTVWIGGDFAEVQFEARAGLAAIDGSSAALLPWNPGAGGVVHALVVRTSGQTGAPVVIYAGGDFTTLGGVNRNFLGAIDPSGITTPWIAEPNGPVHGIVYGSNGIVAAGAFFSAKMLPRQNLAALDVATGIALPWNPGADAGVNTIERLDDTLLVGGAFELIGGALRPALARLDLETGLATEWNAGIGCAECPSPAVYATARTESEDVLYVGGVFDRVGGQSRGNAVALEAASALPLPFDANANGAVRALDLHEQPSFPFGVTVYAGGDFTTVNGGLFGYGPGGIARYGLAALDGATGETHDWNPSRDSWAGVRAVRVRSGGVATPTSIYVGGTFTEVGPFPTPDYRRHAAAFDAGTGLPTTWDPDPDGPVTALVLANGKCHIAGAFTHLGGVARNRIGAVALDDGAATAWDPDAERAQEILTIEPSGSLIHVGGNFMGMSGTAHRHYVAIEDPVVVAVEPRSARALSSLSASPSPFRSRTALHFTLDRRDDVEIAVFDVAGRRVRELHRGPMPAGTYETWWDGCDGAGRTVAAGVYLWTLRRGRGISSRKVLRIP
jgi:trimeric autotransporter adhesin